MIPLESSSTAQSFRLVNEKTESSGGKKIKSIWRRFTEILRSGRDSIVFFTFRAFQLFLPTKLILTIENIWLRCVNFYDQRAQKEGISSLRKENQQLNERLSHLVKLKEENKSLSARDRNYEVLIAALQSKTERQAQEIERLKRLLPEGEKPCQTDLTLIDAALTIIDAKIKQTPSFTLTLNAVGQV